MSYQLINCGAKIVQTEYRTFMLAGKSFVEVQPIFAFVAKIHKCRLLLSRYRQNVVPLPFQKKIKVL